MKKYTIQEAYDVAAAHLLKQKKIAMEIGKCLYRATNGNMCAIGCLIPDDVYKSSFETKQASTLLYDPDFRALFENPDKNFLDELQYVHDGNQPKEWESELNLLAERYNLIPISC